MSVLVIESKLDKSFIHLCMWCICTMVYIHMYVVYICTWCTSTVLNPYFSLYLHFVSFSNFSHFVFTFCFATWHTVLLNPHLLYFDYFDECNAMINN